MRSLYKADSVCSGGGLVFGPYVVRNRPYNSAEYIRLLTEEVFPDIYVVLGDRKWGRDIWQQVFHDLICPSLRFIVLLSGRCHHPQARIKDRKRRLRSAYSTTL